VTENDVTRFQVTGSDPQVTHWTRSHLEVAVEGRKLAHTVHFTSYKAVALRRRPLHDRKWRHMTLVTGSDLKVTSFDQSHLEVAVEGRKLAYTVHFTSYKAVAHRRMQSRDRKWGNLSSGDWKWPRSDVIWPVVTWKWL